MHSELSGLDLGDKRLNARGRSILSNLSVDPEVSIPVGCNGWSETIGSYRFLSNDRVTPRNILYPHREKTLERIRQHDRVLIVQDTTELDYTSKSEKMDGLGGLNRPDRYGLYLHPTVAFSEEGVALGSLDVKFLTRDTETLGTSREERTFWHKEIEEKESFRWLEGYREACKVARLAPNTEVVMVADREADIYEIFEEASSLGKEGAKWLIRSQHNRALAKGNEKYIRELVSSTAPIGESSFELSAREGRAARKVCLSLYTTTVTLRAPRRKTKKLQPQKITVLLAREENPPKGEDPVEWLLLTNVSVRSARRVQQLLEWYTGRWQIEVFFRTLKTGCKVEELQLQEFERLAPCLALYLIVAWRVMFLTMLGRKCPDIPCDTVLEKAEWEAAYIVLHKKPPPKTPPPLHTMINVIAGFGGYLGRKSDPPPGAKAMWIGLQKTLFFAMGIQAERESKKE